MHVDFIFTYTVSSISTCQQVATCFITYFPTLVQISVLHCSSVFTPQHISTRSYSSRPALHRVLPARIHPDSLHTVYYPLVFIPTCFTPCITRSHSSRLAPHRVLPARIHPDALRNANYPLVFIQHKVGYLQAKHQFNSTVRLERQTEYQIKHTHRQHMIPTIQAMFTRTVITIRFHPFLICIIAKRMHLEQH